MKNFTKITRSPMRQFTREFSQLRKTPEFKLVKFDQNSKGDYELFRGLMIINMGYSALQFLVPNLHDDVKDLNDVEEVTNYFDRFGKDKYLRDAYNFVTNNHDLGPLGYKKILRNGEFIGNTGHIMHEINKEGLITKMERGMHLKPEFCSPDLSINPSSTFKPRIGSRIMRLNIQDLMEHKDKLDPNGQLISSILIKNTRSQAAQIKSGNNIGEPTYTENGTHKWVQRIGDYMNRIPEISKKLDESINESKGR